MRPGWWSTLAVVVWLARSVRADPDTDSGFVSAGLSVGYGTRGWVLGVEVSGGRFPRFLEGGYVGAAGGFELATAAAKDEPWGRLYLEGEGGLVFGGVGIGPAVLLGASREVRVQVTPYVALAPELLPNEGGVEPFTVIGLFYRFTSRGDDECPLHDGGTFVKGLWFPNGRTDGGITIH